MGKADDPFEVEAEKEKEEEEEKAAEVPESIQVLRLVIVTLDKNGNNFTVQAQAVDEIAVPTLLRLAAKQVEAQLGIRS